MLPDLDSLALFVHAAELRNLTRAAEASHITVPAASRRLALLEHQFKAQLFERHSRGLELTPAGTDLLSAVLRADDPLQGEQVAFTDLLERDLVGLEGSSTLTRLVTAQAARLMKPMALRVQVRSFEAVCRAIEAGLGIGILPLAAARSFAQELHLKVLPLADEWAARKMQLCARSQPARQTPLGVLAEHLQACAQAGHPQQAA